MRLSVSDLAKLCGISVRTLHYYDEIGLVPPSEVTEAGYRYYDDTAVAKLEQVLFYRELQFSLREITSILAHPEIDRTEALQKQRNLLLLRRRHLDEMLAVLEETMGGKPMNPKKITAAEEYENTRSRYASEVRERWGNTEAYRESEEKEKTRTMEDKAQTQQEAEEIFTAFAALRGQDPATPEIQALVERWQNHITRNYYHCTREILAGLGEMYTADERFSANIDRAGKGTAQLMRDAIRVYCAC